jgi:hypothetical protein
MSNGLRDMLTGPPAVGNPAATQSLVGAQFGFNLGSQTFRVQLAITGLLILAFSVLVLMHMRGQRFSVKV